MRIAAFKDFLFRLVRSPGLYFDAGWAASRRYWFSLVFIAVVCTKFLHIYSHLNSLAVGQFLLWGSTFFLQDVLCLFILRALSCQYARRWARGLAAGVVVPFSIGISGIAAASMSFYIVTGAEIHWRHAHSFYGERASVKTRLTVLTVFVVVEIIFIFVSYFVTPYLYNGVGGILRVLSTSAASVCCFWRKKDLPDPEVYEAVARDDFDDDKSDTDSVLLGAPPKSNQESNHSKLKRILILLPTTVMLLLRCFRPPDPAYWFLSQTLVVTPFAGGGKQHHGHKSINIGGLPGDYSWLGNRTALAPPPKFDWLPVNMAGFRDWGVSPEGRDPYVHYSPEADPLRISNLEEEIIEPFRDALHSGKAKIKHVLLLKLESTREDVFPLRKGSYMYDRVKDSWGKKIPEEVNKRLAKLSRNSERLTGTPAGFDKKEPKPYGGLTATNSYTAGTFTLKSLTGTICGVNPLVVDFNREYLQHIYQPCLPQILNALNVQAKKEKTPRTDNFTSWPWQSAYMQSVPDTYDNQNLLTPVHGYNMNISVNVEKMDADLARNASTADQVNSKGYPDNELRSYFRNAINKAEKNKERLFLTHLTGITHQPWNMPHDKFEDILGTAGSGRHDKKLNRYLNTIGFIDKWLGEILDLLKETGIADETLVVMTGDHGVSLPENGAITAHDSPHVSNFHVPLVFSHPHLPHVEINSSVTSLQILPTILDLLRESNSLSDDSLEAINELLPLYEGQSMIRPIIDEKDGKKNWQFTTMNTGGTWIALRSASKPYRLVIPLLPDVEWRFSNIAKDPKEQNVIMSFDPITMIDLVGRREGHEAVQWINDAAHVTKWWVSENWRRYEYSP